MGVENEVVRNTPAVMEQTHTYPKKRRFHRKINDKNKPINKPVSRGCYNCCYHLSKFYYWKQSPCDTCTRSPAYYCYSKLPTTDITDNWELKKSSWTNGRNMFY